MTPDEFIAWLGPVAQRVCRKYGLPASVCIAQGALESGWGRYVIGEYNLFGRKAVAGDKSITVTTQEYINGEWVTINDEFKDYDSLDEAVEDWCVLMTEEPAYADALAVWQETHDVEQFVRTMGPVYATDPEYADKVLATIRANDLTQYDEVMA
ncbi:Mannosyl-glycoprotein endo-beta-N-acetylglucosamidase [Thermosinus carboxydivorans Nor1]|uniref:Mannosyl-glycoprotein endo-beta-N-acetylglucosamidase n=1 Tax=Thermosinus carboxydivorans Nor1 TaxID=401526 RepID=A1HR64_9FIRM|nr:glucosaminidase domain-containing protein [Thermosinus carboxydivorans]EAX47559.1 Mannosyl-glycoprotein endo-beta-N-acetylglucosamidase [Thermosinus carboxydivorans Nor1]